MSGMVCLFRVNKKSLSSIQLDCGTIPEAGNTVSHSFGKARMGGIALDTLKSHI